jgi:hypothetical protein
VQFRNGAVDIFARSHRRVAPSAFCARRRSIACAICSCSSAIFAKPLFRKPCARARCHAGVSRKSSSRGFLGLSSVDISVSKKKARGASRHVIGGADEHRSPRA